MTIRDAAEFELSSWPDDRVFPLGAAECEALCRGHSVRWRGTSQDFEMLPGRYEMLDGWIMLRR